MELIDVRIMGVPERMDNIRKNMDILGVTDNRIFIDKRHEGVIPNAKRAWLYPTDKPYVMVLQDDILLCDNFTEICQRIVKSIPHSVISLFPYQFQDVNTLARVGGMPTNSPYVTTNITSGCGIIMPREFITPCIKSWNPDSVGDDTSINEWAIANRISVVTTLPATIQHIGDISVVNPKKPRRMTGFYRQEPVANWDNPVVIPWINLISG